MLVYSHAIKKAKKSIHLTIYGLTDIRIIHSLQNKADEGIPVTIYYDPSASPNLEKSFLSNVSLFPIKGKGLMHKKILIVDDKKIYLGSANLTLPSLQMHSNMIVGLRDKSLAKQMKEKQFSTEKTILDNHPIEIYFLPNPSSLLPICDLINQAQKSIRVAMFTFTHPLLTTALIESKKRGVDVQVAVDSQSAKGSSKSVIEKIEEAGIPVLKNKGLSLFHHKWALIDETTFIIGSANWTKSAFSKNQDCFIIIKKLTDSEKKKIKSNWKTILLDSNQ